ncbi:hypothetical protein ES332_D04G156600v1 [Gossypium tomentosum]|uniref:Uncharacterized protein n=1 Tax=Gossypium tomentosum TaxID=34277 RepID=A0A5D2LEN1_GOSTO|nr:hypothetical protein ES332_D04G156600v1 [Gossypium tomentosum]
MVLWPVKLLIAMFSVFFPFPHAHVILPLSILSFSFLFFVSLFLSDLRHNKVSELPIFMIGEGVTTRMQKEFGLIQGELSHMQVEFSQLDARIDACLKDFQEGIKSEVRSKLRSELHSLFE